MIANTYIIVTLSDMFQVPADRRTAMFRELELSLALCEVTRGDRATLDSFEWTDDGVVSGTIRSPGSHDDGVSLRVTKREAEC